MVEAWLWVGTIGMAVGSAGFLVWSLMRGHRGSREEQQGLLTFIVPLTAAVAYLAMALGQGSFLLGDREVFWARYADWSITTPLLLLHFVVMLRIRPVLAAGIIFADVAMILTGFGGALADHGHHVNYLWWIVSSGMFIAIFAILATQLGAYAREGDPRRAAVTRNLMSLLLVLWLVYPIVWLFGTTGNGALSPGAETAIYTVIDLIAKVGFGIVLTLGVSSLRDSVSARQAEPSRPQSAERGAGSRRRTAPSR